MIIGYEYDVFLKMKPLLANHSGDEIYIVTRRRNRKQMLEELKSKNLFYHKLLNYKTDIEFNSRDIIRHKRKAIQYYQIEKFYEDNANEAKDLKSLCPTCDIVLKNLNGTI